MFISTYVALLLILFPLPHVGMSDTDLRTYADSCYASGDYRQAVTLYRSLLSREDSTAAAMLREQKSMDMLISESQKVILRQKYGYIGAAVFIALLIVLLGYVFINMERLNEKNKALYEQILLATKDKPSEITDTSELPSASPPSKLALTLAKVRAEKLYSDPSFGKDTLLSMLGTNESYLYSMFRDEIGTTVSVFITDLRLEYAVDLMKTNKKIYIEDLAIQCGFNNARTLQRLFKTKYGMTPSEFQKFHNS